MSSVITVTRSRLTNRTSDPGSNAVALIANRPYLPGAYATAASILACGLRSDATLAIICPVGALAREERNWIVRSQPRLELVEIDAARHLPGELASWNTPLAPLFLRFALAEIFQSASRILYVDSDILAVRSIDDAFDFDLRGKMVAAADDDLVAGLVGHKPSWIAYRNALGVPLDTRYLNCGVLLQDASLWRERKLKQVLTRLYLENRERCRFFDQSAINLMLKGDFAPLSPAWNFQQNCQALGAEDMIPPRLVHFAGSAKPWRNDGFVFRSAYRARYRDLLRGTPFSGAFESYWRISKRQLREAWRSLNRTLRGREIQSGIRKSEVVKMRAKLEGILQRGDFVDGDLLLESRVV